MPRKDKTGPRGEGPLTGRGLGPCYTDGDYRDGRSVSRGLGRGAGRSFSPGRGQGRNFGPGRGRGIGFGRGHRIEDNNETNK